MQLVNHSPVPADVVVSDIEGLPHRLGLLTAKATFRLQAGRAILDTQQPAALLAADEPTELGWLPADRMLASPPHFEVILLGAAAAPEGQPRERMRVRLEVGSAARELLVFGDRVWRGSGAEAVISEPLPFTRMPLVWERAYGGRCLVEIDGEAFIELSDPHNPLGRGFDAEAMARDCAAALRCPAGYPRLDTTRRLPNLEDPAAPIARCDDAPRPLCWATVPADIPFAQAERLDAPSTAQARGSSQHRAALDAVLGERLDLPAALARLACRAHPDWRIELPQPGAEVRLEGLSPSGPIRFALPRLQVLADWAVGPRRGTLELQPVRLLLLADEARLGLVYRTSFRVRYQPGVERALRLRLQEGWYQPAPGERARS